MEQQGLEPESMLVVAVLSAVSLPLPLTRMRLGALFTGQGGAITALGEGHEDLTFLSFLPEAGETRGN